MTGLKPGQIVSKERDRGADVLLTDPVFRNLRGSPAAAAAYGAVDTYEQSVPPLYLT